jgi:hypothetical protein
MFVTVDERIPDNWIVRVGEDGIVDFEPARWAEIGFWEAYFNADSGARAAYEEELPEILGDR